LKLCNVGRIKKWLKVVFHKIWHWVGEQRL
jgi:hypothetical protein